MQARQIGRPNPTSQARLQLILLLLAAWNLLTFVLELSNSGPIRVDGVDGLLGARSASGAVAVLAIAYVYAARNPVRYRFVLWLASLEQFVALFAATFHWARGDVGAGEAVVPIFVAAAFLVLLMTNMPRQTDTIGA
jgi:hypothetical protein